MTVNSVIQSTPLLFADGQITSQTRASGKWRGGQRRDRDDGGKPSEDGRRRGFEEERASRNE